MAGHRRAHRCGSTLPEASAPSISVKRKVTVPDGNSRMAHPLSGRVYGYGAGVPAAGVASAVSCATSPLANPWRRSAVICPSSRS